MSVFGQLYDLKEELGKGKRFFLITVKSLLYRRRFFEIVSSSGRHSSQA